MALITLLTDFGSMDYFVPALKGVILSINPEVTIIDLTHEIPAHEIRSAAFVLGACYGDFPAGTIHVAVVDPGVGSNRRALMIEAGSQYFIGPDNGIFSHVLAREPKVKVFEIANREYFHHPVSPTFHGRDIFAPVAAHISRGIPPAQIGEEIRDPVRFEIPSPEANSVNGTVEGAIIHIDRFGNCITNLTERELTLEQAVDPNHHRRLLLEGRVITQFASHFDESTNKDELLAYPGSAGYWEIAVRRGSAAVETGAGIGSKVILK